MKRVTFIIAFALIGSLATAQNLEDILKKNRVAIGVDARKKMNNLQSGGYFVMTGTEVKVPFKLFQSKPDRIRIETTVFGFKAIQTYDGVDAWMLNPLQGMEARRADAEDMEFISSTTSIDGPFENLIGNRHPEFIGEKEYKDYSCYVVRVTKSATEHFDYYIDTETYLINFIRYEYEKNGGWYSMEYKVEKYLDFEGAKFPEEVVVSINGVEMTSLYLTKIKSVPEMADKLFKKPSF